jgi:hypothetical protein
MEQSAPSSSLTKHKDQRPLLGLELRQRVGFDFRRDQTPRMQVDVIVDEGSVRADTGANRIPDDSVIAGCECGYTADERAHINEANAAFTLIIKAAQTLEDIENWVPPLVRGVRALRERAMREMGALNHFDQKYRSRFADLLNAEPIGPWLLEDTRRSLLNAVHYLGSDATYLVSFLEWRRSTITDEERKKWRSLRILVDHFKQWQGGKVRKNKDRRRNDAKEIERVRADGHKADAARQAEAEQARQELASRTIETAETLWAVLQQSGPDRLVHAIKEHGGKEYAKAVYDVLGLWLKEPAQ